MPHPDELGHGSYPPGREAAEADDVVVVVAVPIIGGEGVPLYLLAIDVEVPPHLRSAVLVSIGGAGLAVVHGDVGPGKRRAREFAVARLAAGIRGRAAARDAAATIHDAVATRVRDASAVHAVVSAVHDGASGFDEGALSVTAKTMLMLCDSIDSSSLFLIFHSCSIIFLSWD